METLIQILIGVSSVQLISFLGFGYKILRFINRLEFEHEFLWADFVRRTGFDGGRRNTDISRIFPKIDKLE